ncbi:MAG: hypothetical protein AABX52_04560 [Nanoarchaeota archaeon]
MALITRSIIEMLGKPKEHIEETLHNYVNKLKQEKLKILHEEYADAKEQGLFFSVFVELEIEFDSITDLINFCIDSLPSSVEIIEPESVTIEAANLTAALTDLQGHLHELDMVIKELHAKTDLIDRNAVALFRNIIVHLLHQKPYSKEELSAILGIKANELEPFLDRMVEMNLIIPKDNLYTSVS